MTASTGATMSDRGNGGIRLARKAVVIRLGKGVRGKVPCLHKKVVAPRVGTWHNWIVA